MAKDSYPETYVQWARRQPRHKLLASERKMLEQGEEWDEEHPVLAAGLDRLIGREVRLRRSRTSYGDGTYPSGTTFHIICRHGGDLFGIEKGAKKVVITLKPEWIVLAEVWAEEEEDDRGSRRAEEGGRERAQGRSSACRGRVG